MPKFLFGLFVILHGLVHLLYFGQSRRYFELQEGMTWPDGAWAFSRLLGNETTRFLASILCVAAAIILVAGSLGMFVNWGSWRTIVAGGAVFSSVLYLLMWNGKMQRLDNQGAVGILINLAILCVLLILRWPQLET
jgi:hypothetical protein